MVVVVVVVVVVVMEVAFPRRSDALLGFGGWGHVFRFGVLHLVFE